MKLSLINTGGETFNQHRSDFETCPHCKYVRKSDAWIKKATTLILKPNYSKSDSVALITYCPKCLNPSWVHYPLSLFSHAGNHNFPKKWVVAAKKEREKRISEAKKIIDLSLCVKCSKRQGNFHEYNGWRNCDIGSGPPKNNCDHFKSK